MDKAAEADYLSEEETPGDSESESERLAAQLLDLPEDLSSQWQNSNGAAGNKTATGLLEFTTLTNLFNKLHLAGLQRRSLPPDFTPACLSSVLLTVKPLLSSEPICLEISDPVVMFGDLHGEFHILAKLAHLLGRPPLRSYLFLGDYVDRGPHSLETLLYLLLFKSVYPNNVFILRGNHEDRRVYRFFNFEDDLVRIFGLVQGQNLSSLINTVLCYLPLCAILNREIYCCHGGISPHFNHNRFANTQQEFVRCINQRQKPLIYRRWDFAADILWADPLDTQESQSPNLQLIAFTLDEWFDKRILAVDPAPTPPAGNSKRRNPTPPKPAENKAASDAAIGWMPNPRGCSYVFSKTACMEFLRRYGLLWMVRGHMFVSKGYKKSHDGKCITLFTAANYAQKYHNPGAIIAIDGPSNGKDFPGRIFRFSKQSLLKYDGTLQMETMKWPSEIMSHGKKDGVDIRPTTID